MTRLRGASLDSPDAAPHRGGERPQHWRSKIPPNAPRVVAQNTVEVSDPLRVLPWYRDERRRRFNALVRRYKNQLLHGCDDPGCRTPTCASRRRRVSEGPYRRYTELSARTLACYLASLDDAESGLCCNKPRTSSELTMREYHRISQQRSRATKTQSATILTTEEEGAPCNPDLDQSGGNAFRSKEESARPVKGIDIANSVPSKNVHPSGYNFEDLDYAAEQPLKDPKSFTQNLFDTISLRMIEWLPLRRSTDALYSRPKPPSSQHGSKPSPPEQQRRRELEDADANISHSTYLAPGNPRTPSSRSSESQPVELKIPNQHVKRLSITEVDHWRPSPRSRFEEKKRTEYKNSKLSINSHLAPSGFTNSPSPPALKYRSQKHRGRIGELDSTRPEVQSRNQRRVSWDSEKIPNQAAPCESPGNIPLLPSRTKVENESPSNRGSKRSAVRHKPASAPLAQTVTHLTPEIIDGLGQIMVESEDDAESWKEELDRIQSMGSFDNPDWKFANLRQRQVFPFVAQSVFYVFSSTRHILRSFAKDSLDATASVDKDAHNQLDIPTLRGSLQRLFSFCPWDIALHSLWSALDKLFVPPQEFTSSARASHRSSCSSTMTGHSTVPLFVRQVSDSSWDEYLSDADAAYVATVALFVLVSSIPDLQLNTWRQILRMRASGNVASPADLHKLSADQAKQAVEAADGLEHELGLRLANRLVRALTARLAYNGISKARQAYTLDIPKKRRPDVLDLIVDYLSEHRKSEHAEIKESFGQSIGPISLILEMLRTLFLREWDGNPELVRSSAAGGAIQIMAVMYKERNKLGLLPEEFHTPLLAERLDTLEMPVAWARSQPNNRRVHLLSYPFLFPPSFLVIYFRALNYSAMSKYYEAALTTTRHVTQTAFGSITIRDDASLLARMKVSMSTYLVLVVRRDSVLTDALNQLWRREKRELMRPLKVQMGMDEGEEGLDHGGVQQEFFRVLIAEALDPSYGMFTLDSRHRTSWFRPCSFEPIYKFELIGLLMSIAVYNGLTLPVNFPIAFYRKLLDLKVKHLDHIRDGWPELTAGLETLLTWDGDVGDVFMRTYEFSFESFGRIETIDMQKVGRDAPWSLPVKPPSMTSRRNSTAWSDIPSYCDPEITSLPSSVAVETAGLTPCQSVSGETTNFLLETLPSQLPTPPSDEASLVTNQNRHQFVKDYIFWLTDKSIRPQFEAFLRGFHTCLDRQALSIFTPEALKTVVEGFQEIDIDGLQDHTRYEGGFGPDHRVIRDFWSIVRQYSAEKKAQLLEFVTASDRVPVNGVSSIMFVIQKNGVGDLRLPTSLTCFGRLLLPEYTSREALADKLDKALENARGFGVA